MNKRFVISILALIVGLTCIGNSVEASWLSKQWKKLDNLSSDNGSYSRQGSSSKTRMLLVSENQYFKTYVDTNSIEKRGTAQDRVVNVTLIKEYTPLGSQWLGVNSAGDISPDVITKSIVKARFGTKYISYWGQSLYYDVHGNLIYANRNEFGTLPDLGYINGGVRAGAYIPYSEAENIKERLFSMVGWNY